MGTKYRHEVKDPIHAFITFNPSERKVINSNPFQRLRHINQLSLSYLIYPGATHKRFEHSLGVMELAGRAYDSITNNEKISDTVKNAVKGVNFNNSQEISYWRQVIRFAALCHDLGHLPFSHAGEVDLLPTGWDHERLSKEFILSSELNKIWTNIRPTVDADDIVKLALGPKEAKGYNFSDWEALLSEIITGDTFGVDRMDYLLRDSHHTGLIHGKFDHLRLIDTLRIIVPENNTLDISKEPTLGIELGGLTTAEALLISRYLMFSQVYFHPVNRSYSIHLIDFLKEMFPDKFPTDIAEYIKHTDNEIMAAILEASRNTNKPGSSHAKRIIERNHFKLLYALNPSDSEKKPEATMAIFEAVKEKFGEENVRFDKLPSKGKASDFLVYMNDERVESAFKISTFLKAIPSQKNEYIFIDEKIRDKAKHWYQNNLDDILKI